MRTISVKAPDDTEWDVRVVWQPRWPLLVRRFGGWRVERRAKRDRGGYKADVADAVTNIPPSPRSGGGGDFDLGDGILLALVAFIAFIVVGLLFWWVLLPLLLIVLDIAVLLVLFVLATAARVLLGRPWTVEAVAGSDAGEQTRTITKLVRGWRNALRARDDLADALRAGAPTDSPVQAG